MRTPLISLKEFVKNFNSTYYNHRLFEAFKQEFCLRKYINECNEILERYGVYNGQVKFCKELAIFIIDEVDENKDHNQNFWINKEDLDTLYKGIFFEKLHIIANDDTVTGYEASKSHLNDKTLLFDVVEIHINLIEYQNKEDLIIALTHEVTHAYDNWNRCQKKDVETLVDISNKKGYRDILKKLFSTTDFTEKVCAQIIYTFTSIERNAYLSELGAELEKEETWKQTNILNYTQALDKFKKSDTWQRFDVLKYAFENMDNEQKQKFCEVYREIKKVTWADNKILKYVKDKINKAFDKMLTNIPKLYYDFISKDIKENKKEDNLKLSKRKVEFFNQVILLL